MTNKKIWNDLVGRYPMLSAVKEEFFAAHKLLRDCYAAGGKLMVAGNGGSAADAEHIVGELMKGFIKKRPLNDALREKLTAVNAANGAMLADTLQEALPAIALTGHTALTTAFANDRAAVAAMAQQVLGYGRAGDVLLCLSTSGNAKNLVLAATVAKAMGISVLLVTGAGGGKLLPLSDVAIRLPAVETYLVQEMHLPLYHALCMMLESDFFKK
jgi:D-sedoheptulose 7-phosphate isomerase